MKHALISRLEYLWERRDRGAMAALRRGLSSASEAEVYPIVAPFFSERADPRRERAYVLVAALFALHPGSDGMSIGAALRKVRNTTGSDSVERRFAALLDSHVDDLPIHLRHAVTLIHSSSDALPIDWNDLLRALINWDDEQRWVQHRWARDFWAAPGAEGTPEGGQPR